MTLAAGRRKKTLHERLEGETIPLFAGRVLYFDDAASQAYARLQAAARKSGHSPRVLDALIAGICSAHNFALATRNVRHFQSTGLVVIDPWDGLTS